MDQALDDLREEIESIDCGLLRLWEKRMYTAVKVGVYKRNNELPVFDAEREKQLWFNWQQQLDEDNADLAALMFQANTAAAKLRQDRICRAEQPNIYLIGMPGCGKTAAGQEAAKRLGRGFCDLDSLICASLGRSKEQIASKGGEDQYHRMETALLSALAAEPAGTIVATGDGIVLTPLNISLMRASGAMILIEQDYIEPEDPQEEGCPWCADTERWNELWGQRHSLYRGAAAATVQGGSSDDTAAQIVELLD